MAGLFAAEVIAAFEHAFDHVSVADFGADRFTPSDFSASSRPRLLMTVATTVPPLRRSFLLHLLGAHRKHMIAVEYLSRIVDEDGSIGVAVQDTAKSACS